MLYSRERKKTSENERENARKRKKDIGLVIKDPYIKRERK